MDLNGLKTLLTEQHAARKSEVLKDLQAMV